MHFIQASGSPICPPGLTPFYPVMDVVVPIPLFDNAIPLGAVVTTRKTPPTLMEVMKCRSKVVHYQEPFYDNAKDVPMRPKMFGAMEFNVPCYDLQTLPEFKSGKPTEQTVAIPTALNR